MSDLLTADGFDAAKVVEMIKNADLNPLVKSTLTKAVEAAGDNPELIGSVIEQIKSALGQ
jgi:hypothetical protein